MTVGQHYTMGHTALSRGKGGGFRSVGRVRSALSELPPHKRGAGSFTPRPLRDAPDIFRYAPCTPEVPRR